MPSGCWSKMGKITKAKPRIREKNGMDFPHQGKMLTAMYPFYDNENSRTFQNLIRKKGYVEPTSTQVISFVHKYFDGHGLRAYEVGRTMRYGSFRGFTGILYVPKKGALGKGLAHFIDYPEFDEEGIIDRDNLLKRLDESYAQVPFEYFKREYVNWKTVAKHPYIYCMGWWKRRS